LVERVAVAFEAPYFRAIADNDLQGVSRAVRDDFWVMIMSAQVERNLVAAENGEDVTRHIFRIPV
jgi:hypothetical protein